MMKMEFPLNIKNLQKIGEKRSEAFEYMIFVSRKLNKRFYLGPDFIVTKIINYFI